MILPIVFLFSTLDLFIPKCLCYAFTVGTTETANHCTTSVTACKSLSSAVISAAQIAEQESLAADDEISITLTTDLRISSSITIPETTPNITLILDGHTVTNEVENDYLFILSNHAHFKINGADGTMTTPSPSSKGLVFVNNYGATLEVSGGTFTGTCWQTSGMFFLSGDRNDFKDLAICSKIELKDMTVTTSMHFLISDGSPRTHDTLWVRNCKITLNERAAQAGRDTLKFPHPILIDGVEAEFENVEITAAVGPCVAVTGHHSNTDKTVELTKCTFKGSNKFLTNGGNGNNCTTILIDSGGVVYIEDGEYSCQSAGSGIPAAVFSASSGTYLTITGGTFKTQTSYPLVLGMDKTLNSALNYALVVNIAGGTFYGWILTTVSAGSQTGEGFFTITGGTWKHPTTEEDTTNAMYIFGEKQPFPLKLSKTLTVASCGGRGLETVCSGTWTAVPTLGYVAVVPGDGETTGDTSPAVNILGLRFTITTHVASEDVPAVPVIYTSSPGKLTLKSDTFTWNAESPVPLQCPVISAQDGVVEMDGCTFSDIQLADQPALLTADTTASLVFASTTTENAGTTTTTTNTFTGICRLRGRGAVISASLSAATNGLALDNAVFTACTCAADSAGGASVAGTVYVELGDADATLTLGSALSFTTVTENPSQANSAITISTTPAILSAVLDALDTQLKNTADGNSWTTPNNKYFAIVSFDEPLTSELSHYYQSPSGQFYYSSTGASYSTFSHCGWEDLPCDSISDTYALLTTATDTLVYEQSSEYSASDLVTSVGKDATFDGQGSTFGISTSVAIASPFITITPLSEDNGITVTYTSMIFKLSVPTADLFSQPLMSVASNANQQTASLTLNTVTLEGVTGENSINTNPITSNIIDVAAGSLTITNSVFKNIKLGTCSAIAYSSALNGLSLSWSTFSSIVGAKEGPVLYITLPPETTSELPQFTALSFADNSYTSGSTVNNAIYINLNSATLADPSVASWVGLLQSTGMAESLALLSNSTDLYTLISTSLSFEIESGTSTLEEAVKANSYTTRTITYKEDVQTTYSAPTATIEGGANPATVLVIERPLTVTGKGKAITIQSISPLENAESIFYVNFNGDVTFSDLAFEISSTDESQMTSIIFDIPSVNQFTLSTVSFTVPTPAGDQQSRKNTEVAALTNSLISIHVGSLTLNGASFESISFESGASLISASTASLTIIGSEFTTITLADTPLLLINPTSTSTFSFGSNTVSTFSGIHRVSGRGAVIDTTLSTNTALTLAHASFSNCYCTASAVDGATYTGSIALTLADDGATLAFGDELTFKSKSNDDVWTSGTDSAIVFITSDASYLSQTTNYDLSPSATGLLNDFSDGWSADHVYKYTAYITSPSTYNTPLIQIFKKPSFADAGSTTFSVSSTGVDEAGCGWAETLPCLTLSQTLSDSTHLPTALTLSAGTLHLAPDDDTLTLTTPLSLTGTGTAASPSSTLPLVARSTDTRTACVLLSQTNGDNWEVEFSTLIVQIAPSLYSLSIPAFMITTEEGTGTAQTCTLKLTSITFNRGTASPGAKIFTSSLVNAEAGKLQITSCTFQSLRTSDKPLLVIPTVSGAFSITGATKTSFDSISRGTYTPYYHTLNTQYFIPSGATVFELPLTSGAVTIEQATFTKCQCTNWNSYGGSIYVYQTGGELTLQDCSFTTGAVQAVGGLGGAIYIATTLSGMVSFSNLVFAAGKDVIQAGTTYSGYYVYYKLLSDVATLSLDTVLSLLENNKEAILDGNDFMLEEYDADGPIDPVTMRRMKITIPSHTEDACDASSSTCYSLAKAIEFAEGSTYASILHVSITLASNIELEDEAALTITRGTSILGSASESTISTLTYTTIGENSPLTISASTSDFDVTLSTLLIKLSQDSDVSLIKLTSNNGFEATLILDTVTITAADPESPPTFSEEHMIDATAGKLHLKAVVMEYLSVDASTSLIAAGADKDDLIMDADGDKLNTFRYITSQYNYYALVFYIENVGEGPVIISNALFYHISEGDDGAAIYAADLASPDAVILRNVYFLGCKAGAGHNIYLAPNTDIKDLTGWTARIAELWTVYPTTDYIVKYDYSLFDDTSDEYLPIYDPPTDVLIVDGERGDDEYEDEETNEPCGLPTTYPCLTITAAITKNEGVTKVNLAPGDHPAEAAEWSLESELTITGHTLLTFTTIKHISPSNTFTIQSDESVTFQELSFQISSYYSAALTEGTVLTESAFSHSGDGSLIFRNVRFTMTPAPDDETVTLSAPLISSSSGSVTIEGSTFTSITCSLSVESEQTVTGGAVASLTLAKSGETATIKNIQFLGCSSSSDDGTILAGVLYISIEDDEATLDVEDVTFSATVPEGTRKNDGTVTGEYVYIACPEDYSIFHKDEMQKLLPGEYSGSGEFMYCEANGEANEISSIPTLVQYFVAAVGEGTCADADNECVLNTAIAKINADTTDTPLYRMKIDTSAAPSDDLEVVKKSARISGTTGKDTDKISVSKIERSLSNDNVFVIGEGSDKEAITVEFKDLAFSINTVATSITSKSVFFITSNADKHTLKLSSVDFVVSAGQEGDETGTFAESVISSANGILSLSSVSFTGFEMNSQSLLTLGTDDDSLSMTGTNKFEKISRASTDDPNSLGGAVFSQVTPAVIESISSVQFIDCVSAGCGGAISVSATTADLFVFGSSVSFTGCFAEGRLGHNVFVYLADGVEAPVLSWDSLKAESTIGRDYILRSKPDSTETFTPIITITDDETDVTVDEGTGYDSSNCGNKVEGPCRTFAAGVKRIATTEGSQVILEEGEYVNGDTQITLSSSLTIDGQDKAKASLTVSCVNDIDNHAGGTKTADGAIVIEGSNTVKLTIQKLTIIVKSTQDAELTARRNGEVLNHPVITAQESAGVELNTVDVKWYSLTEEEEESLELSAVTSSVISMASGGLTLDTVTVTGIQLSGASLVSAGAGLSVTDCVFDSITATGTAGGVFALTLSTENGQASIRDSEFDACKGQSGGAVAVTFSDKATLSISGTTFVGCQATAGSGGAIHATITSTTEETQPTLSIDGSEVTTVFDGCSATVSGGALYITTTYKPTLTFTDVTFSGTAPNVGTFVYYVSTATDGNMDEALATIILANQERANTPNYFMYNNNDGGDTNMISLLSSQIVAATVVEAGDEDCDGSKACVSLAAAVGKVNSAAVSVGNTITFQTDPIDHAECEIEKGVDITGSDKTWTLDADPSNALISVGQRDTATARNLAVSVTSLTIALTQNVAFTQTIFHLGAKGSYTRSLFLSYVTIQSTSESAVSTSASVISAENGRLTLTACTFTALSLSTAPLLSISTGEGDFTMLSDTPTLGTTNYNTFDAIQRTGANNGVILSIASLPASASITIGNAKFVDCCTAAGQVGLFYFTLDEYEPDSEPSIELSENLFFKQTVTSETPGQPSTEADLDFTSNEVTSDKTVIGFALDSRPDLSDATFYGLVTSDMKSYPYKYYATYSSRNAALVHFAGNPSTGSVYVSTAGLGDASYCGWVDLPCDTLGNAYTVAQGQSLEITITASNTVSDSVTINTAQTVQGADMSSTLTITRSVDDGSQLILISTSPDAAAFTATFKQLTVFLDEGSSQAVQAPVFRLEKGENLATLSLESLSFQPVAYTIDPITSSNTASITSSVIDASAGILRLKSCQFTHLLLDTVPLLTISTAYDEDNDNHFAFVEEQSTFITITSSGNGAVFSLSLSDTDDYFDLSYASFTDCSSSAGLAGAICILAAGNAEHFTIGQDGAKPVFARTGGFVNDEKESAITLVYSQGSTQGLSTTDGYGKTIVDFDDEYEGENENMYYFAIDETDYKATLKTALTSLVTSTTESLLVKETGVDFPACGDANTVPCASLSQAYTLLASSEQETQTIILDSGAALPVASAVITITRSISISGSNKETLNVGKDAADIITIQRTDNADPLLAVDPEVTLTQITFAIRSNKRDASEFVEEDIQSFTGSVITSDSKGDLTLSSVDFTWVTTEDYDAVPLASSVISVSACLLKLTTVTATNIQMGARPFLSISSAASLTMESTCVFDTITATSGTAAVANVALGSSTALSLSSSSFESCSVTDGTKASVFYITIDGDNTPSFSVSDLTFTAPTGSRANALVETPFVYIECTENYATANAIALSHLLTPTSTNNDFTLSIGGTEGALLEHSVVYHVRSDGTVGSECTPAVPCNSLTAVYTAYKNCLSTQKSISIDDPADDDVTTFDGDSLALSIDTSVSIEGASVDGAVLSFSTQPSVTVPIQVTSDAAAVTAVLSTLTLSLSIAYNEGAAVSLLSVTSGTAAATLTLANIVVSGSECTLGAPLISATNGILELRGASFADIVLSSSSLLEVGTGNSPKSFVMADYSGTRNSFTNISTSATDKGAILSVSLTAATTILALAQADFKACSSSSKNGLIRVSVGSEATSASFSIDSVDFYTDAAGTESSYPSADPAIAGVVFVAEQLSYVTGGSSAGLELTQAAINTAGNKYYGIIGTGAGIFTAPLTHFTTSTSGTLYIGLQANDATHCGWIDYPCGLLGSLKTCSGTHTLLLSTAFVGAAMTLTNSLSLTGQSGEVESVETTTTIHVTDTHTFTAAAYSLTLSTLIITKVADGFTALQTSLITATGGTLTLTSVEFTDITLTGKALIDAPSATVTLVLGENNNLVSFSTIKRTDKGHGAVMEDTISSAALDLTYATFTDCGTTNADADAVGAAVKLTMNDATKLTSLGTTFVITENSAEWTSSKLCGLWIVASPAVINTDAGNKISALITDLDVTSDNYDTLLYKYYATVDSTTDYPTSLIHVYQQQEDVLESYSALYVSDNGVDVPGCGWSQLPCSSLSVTHSHISSIAVIQIADSQSASAETDGYELTTSLTIQGASSAKNEKIKVPTAEYTNDAVFTISPNNNEDQTLTFKNIEIDLSDLEDTLAVVVITTGTADGNGHVGVIVLNTVTVTGHASYTLTGYLIDSSTGRLELTNTLFTQIKVSSNPLLHPALTATGLSMTSAQFTSVSRTDTLSSTAGASVFLLENVGATDYLNLGGATFTSCAGAEGGLGGAVYIQLSDSVLDTDHVSFSSTSFTGTFVANTPSKGYYIYIDASSCDSDGGATFASTHMVELLKILTNTEANYYTYKDSDTEQDLDTVLAVTVLAVTVAGSGECSTSEPQCDTLKNAVELIETSGALAGNTISINEGQAITGDTDSSLHITKGVIISGHSNKNTLTLGSVENNAYLRIEATSTDIAVGVSNIDVKISAAAAGDANTVSVISILPSLSNLAHLTLTDTTFTSGVDLDNGNQPTCHVKASVIDASAGKLTLSGVQFSYITLDNSPLLVVNLASEMFVITSGTTNSFSEIKRTTGSGSVFAIVHEESTPSTLYLPMNDVSFDSCDSPAIYISTNKPFPVLLGTSVTFSGAEETGDQATGKYVHYIATTSEANLYQDDVNAFITDSASRTGDVTASFKAKNFETDAVDFSALPSIPVTVTLVPAAETTKVRTLESALTLTNSATDSDTRSVSMSESSVLAYTEAAGTVISLDVSVTGTSANTPTLTVKSLTGALFRLAAEDAEQTSVVFQYIDISITGTLAYALFSVDASNEGTASLSLKDLSVGCTADPVETSLISFADGHLALYGVAFTSVTIDANCPLLLVNPAANQFEMNVGTDGHTLNTFTSICRNEATATTGGAVFSIASTGANDAIQIQNAEFIECGMDAGVTDYVGGIIFISVTQTTASVSASSLTFTPDADTSAHTNTPVAPYVYISLPNAYSSEKLALLRGFLSTDYTLADSENYQYELDGSAAKEISTIPLTFYVMKTGYDEGDKDETCRTADKTTCESISTVLNLPTSQSISITSADVIAITYDAAYTLSVLTRSLSQTITITGVLSDPGNNKPTIEVTNAALNAQPGVSITAATAGIIVSFTTLHFVLDTSAAAIAQPLFSVANSASRANSYTATLKLDDVVVTGDKTNTVNTYVISAATGVLQLTNVEFKTISLSGTPLLALDLVAANEAFSIETSASFSDITRTASGAAVLEADLATDTLDLSAASFSDCGTTDVDDADAVGAAVGITLSNSLAGLTIDTSKFSISNEAGTDDDNVWGNKKLAAILFTAPDAATFTAVKEALSAKLETAWSTGTESYEKKYYLSLELNLLPLIYSYSPPSTTIYMARTSDAVSAYCGWYEYACQTLTDSLTNLGSNTEIILQYSSEFDNVDNFISFPIQLNKQLSIIGELDDSDTRPLVTITNPSENVMTVTGVAAQADIAVTIKAIQFALNTASDAFSKSLFTVSSAAAVHSNTGGAALVLEDVKISESGSNHMSTYLIDASEGTLILKSVEFESITMTGTALLNINTASTQTFQLLKSDSNENNKFTSITRTEGSGSVLEIEVDASTYLTLQNTDLKGCYSTEQDAFAQYVACAGAVLLTLTETGGHFTITTGTLTATDSAGGDDLDAIYKSAITLASLGGTFFGASKESANSYVNAIYSFYENEAAWNADATYTFSAVMMNDDDDRTTYLPKTLKAYYTASTVEGSGAVLGAQGVDVPACGVTAFPCQTLSYALTQGAAVKKVSVLASNSIAVDNLISTISDKMDVIGTPGTSVFAIGCPSDPVVGGLIKISTAEAVSFSSLKISITSYALKEGVDQDDEIKPAPLENTIIAQTSTGSLTLTSVTFEIEEIDASHEDDYEYSPLSSSVISTTSGALTLQGVTFTSVGMDGAALLTAGGAVTIESDSSFTSITRATGKGAVLEKSLSTGEVDIKSTTFTGCASEGGIFAFTISASLAADALKIEDEFNNKEEVAITVKYYSEGDTDQVWSEVAECAVVFVTSSTEHFAQTEGFTIGTDAAAKDYETNEKKYYAVVGDSENAHPLLHYMKSPAASAGVTDPAVYVDASSAAKISTTYCGWSEMPCATLSAAVTAVASTQGTMKVVAGKTLVDNAATVAKTMNLQGGSAASALRLTSATSTNQLILVDGTAGDVTLTVSALTIIVDSNAAAVTVPVFKLSSSTGLATLALTSVVFQPTADAAGTTQNTLAIQDSVIDASNGTLELTSVTFKYLRLDHSPLLSVSTAAASRFDLKTGQSTFTSITRDTGSGAVLSVALSSASTVLALKNAAFTDCVSTTGVAGAVFIDAEAKDTGLSFGTDDAKPTFTNNLDGEFNSAPRSAITIAIRGADVLGSEDEENTYLDILQTFDEHYASTDAGMYYAAIAKDDSYVHAGTVASYITAPTITAAGSYVSEDGQDVAGCGVEALPCRSLKTALSKSNTQTKMTLSGEISQEDAELSLTRSITFTGSLDEEDPTFIVLDEEQASTLVSVGVSAGASNADTTVTFSSLYFALGTESKTATEGAASFFTVTSGTGGKATLAFDHVTFTSSLFEDEDDADERATSRRNPSEEMPPLTYATLSAPLINAADGVLSLADCSFVYLQLFTTSLLKVSPAKDALTMSGDNKFTDIQRKAGHGGVFEVSLTSTSVLVIKSGTFTRCGTLSGNGGAVSVTVSGGTFTLGQAKQGEEEAAPSVSFTGCYAKQPNSGSENTPAPEHNAEGAGNGGSVYMAVEEGAKDVSVSVARVEVADSQAASSGGGLYVAVAENTDTVSVSLADVGVSKSSANDGVGGGVFVDVAKGTTGVSLSVTDVSVSESTATHEETSQSGTTTIAKTGEAIYLNVKSDDTKLDFKSVSVKEAETQETATTQSAVFVAVTNSTTASNADLWKEISTSAAGSDTSTGSAGSSSVTVATQTSEGKVLSTQTADKIVAEAAKKPDDDDKSYWWIVFPILAFVIIIVVLVILDYILVCRKEQEGDKATKYEEGSEKAEEMETTKFEEEAESELALVTVPSVSEKPDEEYETTPSEESKPEETKAEETKPEETKAEEPTTETTTSSSSSTEPSSSEAPATESSSSSSPTESSPSEPSSSAEASSSSASASSSSSSEPTPSEASAQSEPSSTESSTTSSSSESSPSDSSQPSAQSEPSEQSEPSPKEEPTSSSSTSESSETVAQ